MTDEEAGLADGPQKECLKDLLDAVCSNLGTIGLSMEAVGFEFGALVLGWEEQTFGDLKDEVDEASHWLKVEAKRVFECCRILKEVAEGLGEWQRKE